MVQAFIKSALVTAINDQCNDCGFTDVYISGEKLYCDCLLSMTVIYRANISNFANYTSDQLLSLLEIWIHGAPQVRNGVGQDIAFDAGFPVRLAVDDGVVCTSSSIAIPRPTGGGVPPTTADQLNLPAVISASVIGSLLIFILLVILFMFIFLIRLRHRYSSTKLAYSGPSLFWTPRHVLMPSLQELKKCTSCLHYSTHFCTILAVSCISVVQISEVIPLVLCVLLHNLCSSNNPCLYVLFTEAGLCR